MREGGRLYRRCHRQTCIVCVDQRLAATETTCTGPCSALLPPNYKTHQKEGRETTLPLVVLAGNPTPEREKKILRKAKGWRKEAEEVCKDMERKGDWTSEQEGEQKIQISLEEDLWFGKGVVSALTKLVLAGTVQYSTVRKVMDETGVKLPGLLSVWLSRLQPCWKPTVNLTGSRRSAKLWRTIAIAEVPDLCFCSSSWTTRLHKTTPV